MFWPRGKSVSIVIRSDHSVFGDVIHRIGHRRQIGAHLLFCYFAPEKGRQLLDRHNPTCFYIRQTLMNNSFW